jgi:hypothetical protein
MEDCLMNLNKGEDDFGGGNILQYSEWNDMVEGYILKDCLESTARYDNRSIKVQWQEY